MDNVPFDLINFNQKEIIPYPFVQHVQLAHHPRPLFSTINLEILHFKRPVDYRISRQLFCPSFIRIEH